MASTATLYASTASGGTGIWVTPANAQGAPNGTYATWTNSTSGATGALQLTGYNVQAAIGSPSAINFVDVQVTCRVDNPANYTSAVVQLYYVSGSQVAIGSGPLTLSAGLTTQTVRITGVAWHQIGSLQVYVQATRAATTVSDTFYVDAIGLVADYTTGPAVYIGPGGTYQSASAVSSFTLSTGAVTAGQTVLLRVGLRGMAAGATVTASDASGSTWVGLASNTAANSAQTFVLGAVMAASGTFTVTVSLSSAPLSAAASAEIFHNLRLTLDGQGSGSSAANTTARSVSAFPAQAGDMAFVVVTNSTTGALSGMPASFVALKEVDAGISLGLHASYSPVTSTGSISWSATTFSSAYTAVGLALQPIPNQPPTANAGPDQSVAAGATVTLAGTDSDPDGSIATRAWMQTGGPTVTLSGSGATRTFTATVVGAPSTLVFRYTVTDSGGLTASDDVTVNVAALPAPVAAFTATPTSGTAPLAVSFTDTSTGGPTSWAWDFGDGATSTAQHPTHTYTAAGTYTATLTASNAGGSSTATTTITVTPATADRLRLGAGTVALRLGAGTVALRLGDTLIWP